MPSVMRKFLPFGKKNKGPKFSEFQGYDDLRHSAYPIAPHAHQSQPPPHTFAAQRQHQQQHYQYQNQLYPQQLIASPQAHNISQCQCQQCSYQQQQVLSQQQPQTQLLASPTPGQPHSVALQPQALHQSQSQPQIQLQPQQPVQTTIQHFQTQQQHPQLQPQFAQHFVSQTTHVSAPQTNVAQCTCQLCPYQQQLQQQQMQQQQHHQQQQQHTLQGQQMQLNHMIQMNGTNTCQHQVNQMQLNHQSPLQQHQQQQQQQQFHLNHGHVIQQQQNSQMAPILMQPMIQPTLQQQQMQQPLQTQLQPQQFQCHTIQTPAKQHHHQRVQSLHQQSLPAYQPHTIQQHQSHNQQSKTQHQTRHQDIRVESQSESHNFSRYANMQSLLDDQTKFEEHVYCNQKLARESALSSSGPTLPPYVAPPDYETYLQQRKIELKHHTFHSESLHVGYANLSNRFSPYGNLGVGRQEPGFTS